MNKQNLQILPKEEIERLRSCGQLLTPSEAEEYRALQAQRSELERLTQEKMMQQAEIMANHLTSCGRLLTPEQAEEYRILREASSDQWLSGKEAATFLNCSQSQICKLAARGKLEFYIQGKVPKYSKSGLIRFREKYRFFPTVKDFSFN